MRSIICFVVIAFTSFSFLSNTAAQDKDKPAADFVKDFPIDKDELVTTGRNTYFILEPGYFQVMESGELKLTMTVTNQTKKIGDFEVRVVEEKTTAKGKLIENNRSYFAISKKNKNVYFFGLDVEAYDENGKVVSTEGTWQHGMKDAKFGLVMPGTIVLKAKYYQEQAPNVAMDRAENLSVTETVVTPDGTFKNCLKVEETSPLDEKYKVYKYYAPDVGLVQSIEFKLTKHGVAK